jgi:hypothetical protein
LKETTGNIWALAELSSPSWVVVPCNIGWKSDGANVMGAGVAKDAANKFPGLDIAYGSWCKKHREDAGIFAHEPSRTIFFPVKSLNPTHPWLSWKNGAAVWLVERSTQQLADLKVEGQIFLPLVGCGHGRLTPGIVLPILRKILSNDRFVLVTLLEYPANIAPAW